MVILIRLIGMALALKTRVFSQIYGMQLVIVSEPMQNNNIRTDLPTYYILVLENTISS